MEPFTPQDARDISESAHTLISPENQAEIQKKLISQKIVLSVHGTATFSFVDVVKGTEFLAMVRHWGWTAQMLRKRPDCIIQVWRDEPASSDGVVVGAVHRPAPSALRKRNVFASLEGKAVDGCKDGYCRVMKQFCYNCQKETLRDTHSEGCVLYQDPTPCHHCGKK